MANKQQAAKQKKRISSAKEAAKRTESTFTPKHFKIPKGYEQYKFREEGKHKIDIIPFETKAGNPACDPGLLHYERTFYIHDNVGPNNDRYCCPVQTFGRKHCCICDHRSKLKNDPTANQDYVKSLYPKKRHLYKFRDLANKDKKFIYECGHKRTFGELLQDAIDLGEEDSGYDTFHDPENGKRIVVATKDDTYNNNKFQNPVRIDFIDRKPLDDSLLDDVCLDDLLIEVDNDDLAELFFEGSNGKKKAGKAAKKDDDEDEDEDDDDTDDSDEENDEEDDDDDDKSEAKFKPKDRVEHDEHGTCVVKSVSDDGTSYTIVDEDGKIHKAIDEADLEPVKAKAGKGGKPAAKRDEDDDEDDDSDSEEEGDEDDDEGEDDEDDSEEDSDEESDSDDDDDDDEEPLSDDDDEEEEEKPAPKKPTGKKK